MAGDRFDDAGDNIGEVIHIVEKVGEAEGFTGLIGGFATVNHDFNETAERDLQKSEVFALPLALIILVLVFSAIVAAFVPILLAIFAIILAIALTAILGQVFQFSFFVQNMIIMMGRPSVSTTRSSTFPAIARREPEVWASARLSRSRVVQPGVPCCLVDLRLSLPCLACCSSPTPSSEA